MKKRIFISFLVSGLTASSILLALVIGVTISQFSNSDGAPVTDPKCIGAPFVFPTINPEAPPIDVGFYISRKRMGSRFEEFKVAIRSLLVHRTCPINFHMIMVDDLLDNDQVIKSAPSKRVEDLVIEASALQAHVKQQKLDMSKSPQQSLHQQSPQKSVNQQKLDLQSPQKSLHHQSPQKSLHHQSPRVNHQSPTPHQGDPMRSRIEGLFTDNNVQNYTLNFSYPRGDNEILVNLAQSLETLKTPLYKAIPETIFPATVKQVLVLDSDIIILQDICKGYVSEMEKLERGDEKVLALAPLFDYTYLGDDENLDAIDIPDSANWLKPDRLKGLDGSIGFFNLAKMRALNWSHVLMERAQAEKKRFPEKLQVFIHQHLFNWMGERFVSVAGSAWNFQVAYRGDQMGTLRISSANRLSEILILQGSGLLFRSDVECIENLLWWLYEDDGTNCLASYGGGGKGDGNLKPINLFKRILQQTTNSDINDIRLHPFKYTEIMQKAFSQNYW